MGSLTRSFRVTAQTPGRPPKMLADRCAEAAVVMNIPLVLDRWMLRASVTPRGISVDVEIPISPNDQVLSVDAR
jgi:hypothetical protein